MSYNVATIDVLWRRDLKRFWRQPSRLVGALAQPFIFWLVIGGGMGASFSIPGVDVDYMEYFFPGVVMMVLLFASIFASVSVIDDRHQGFLQAILAGPGSRSALVVGKSLGSASVALLQAGLFVILAPAAGFSVGAVDWPLLISTLVLTSLGLTAMGFAVAWWLDNMPGYHAIQMTLLVPLWIVSGAMFPASGEIFTALQRYNPIAYAVSSLRHALYGSAVPRDIVLSAHPWAEIGVVAAFGALCFWWAVAVCKRRS